MPGNRLKMRSVSMEKRTEKQDAALSADQYSISNSGNSTAKLTEQPKGYARFHPPTPR